MSLLFCLFSAQNHAAAYGHGDITADSCGTPQAYVLYPNPTEAYVQIRVQEGCFQPYSLYIYNIIGQLVVTSQISQPLSQKVDIQPLTDGVYLAVLDFGGQTISKKFLKGASAHLPIEAPLEEFAPQLLINSNFN